MASAERAHHGSSGTSETRNRDVTRETKKAAYDGPAFESYS